MTEEEKKAIEDYKRVIAMYFKYSDYDLFCSNLMKSGIKGTIQNTMADMVNLIEKLKKENEELKNKVVKRDKELIKLEEYANKNFERKDDVKAKYIPKSKIRKLAEELNKEIDWLFNEEGSWAYCEAF